MSISVTVVLCCHNSAKRLPATLSHLAAVQVPPGMSWEVLVVDNASTDDTRAHAHQIWAQAGAPAPLRVVAEPQMGLNHARWTGIRAACHDIVSFVDDDNWVDPQWLHVLAEVFAGHGEVGAVGGLAQPAFEGKAPDWFAAVQEWYACGPQADTAGPISAQRGYLHGAGLSIRRIALEDLVASGFAPQLVGRSGRSLAAGEDTELCHALTAAGWTLWYEPRLRLQHFMPAGRLTLGYARKLSFELGRATIRLNATRPQPQRSLLASWIRIWPIRAAWYATLWLTRSIPLPGCTRHPVQGSYQLGRFTEVISYRRAR